LFSPLQDTLLTQRSWFLDHWYHRKGKRSRLTATPLYRLRLALSQLWLAFRPPSSQIKFWVSYVFWIKKRKR
jgi:hypothetical protein